MTGIPGDGEGVLQLVVGAAGIELDGADRWARALLCEARRRAGFLDGRILVSADGQRVVLGLRWRDAEAMADAALTLPTLRGVERTAVTAEPMVFALDGTAVRDDVDGGSRS